jgi:hypothetical protein
MKKATNKDNFTKVEILGQYNTSIEGTDMILSEFCKTNISKNTLFIEPSFGSGNFIKSFRKKYNNPILGVEIDQDVFQKLDENIKNIKTFNDNFYDFEIDKSYLENINDILFVGNPPYRTPALSLKDRRSEIDRLKKLYKIDGIKEECVFFILKTYDVIFNTGKDADVYYILPKTIFQNPTKAFKSFYNFLNDKFNIVSVDDIDKKYFENVSQNLILVHFSTKIKCDKIKHNGESMSTDDFLGENTSIIPFNKIFKKTYLGSVPAESFLLSCKDESKEQFIERIKSIFFEITNIQNLKQKLTFNNKHHLSKIDDKKLSIILSYINEIKDKFDIDIFKNEDNYKKIKHRNEYRFYFRHDSLKKVSFVYIINSNPCESFYFTSNPTSISTDYFGYTDYDANRNSTPGGLRTVPIENMESNLTDDFKLYWSKNTNLPYSRLYEYMLFVSKSDWYKNIKKTYGKFYFGIPVQFLTDFIKEESNK